MTEEEIGGGAGGDMTEEEIGGGAGVTAGVELRDWSELTPECLANVFRRLPLKDRWSGAMMACKAWLDAARDPSLHETLDLEPFFSGGGASSGGGGDAAEWWTDGFQRRVDSMVMAVAGWGGVAVREIRVRHCSDLGLDFVADRCPNLKILAIKSSQNVTDVSLVRIARGCPKLRELDISNCYEISSKSLEVIGDHCSNLTILKRNLLNWLDPSQHTGIVPSEYLNALPQDGDTEASVISRFMPKLKHLELRFSKLSISGLLAISEGCRDLETLDLFGCANLTSRAMEQARVNLKNLKTLVRPNFYIPRSVFHADRYGHWRLYDERFQTNVFHI